MRELFDRFYEAIAQATGSTVEHVRLGFYGFIALVLNRWLWKLHAPNLNSDSDFLPLLILGCALLVPFILDCIRHLKRPK